MNQTEVEQEVKSWYDMHRCTSNCPSSCTKEPYSVDTFRKFRLPRGWMASNFIGPFYRMED